MVVVNVVSKFKDIASETECAWEKLFSPFCYRRKLFDFLRHIIIKVILLQKLKVYFIIF